MPEGPLVNMLDDFYGSCSSREGALYFGPFTSISWGIIHERLEKNENEYVSKKAAQLYPVKISLVW